MTRPVAVLVGGIGKLPYAGMTYYYLHHVHGLLALGYDVHYVERLNRPDEYYDPSIRAMTTDVAFAADHLSRTLAPCGLQPSRWSLIDSAGRCHGSGWNGLRDALDRADFLLAIADPTWFDDLERCDRRAYIDGDPVFTQAAMLSGDGLRAHVPSHYPVLFSYGVRMGASDCSLPAAGRTWLAARPVVATRLWDTAPAPSRAPITTVMHWAAGRDVSIAGRSYGHKDREFEAYIGLPRRAGPRFVIAVGGRRTPRTRLLDNGWQLEDPLAVSGTLDAYREFIGRSLADLAIAKHAYVASRCGWFSDRSTSYLAASRPVLHHDTGCGDWLPSGDGVLLFSCVDELVEAIIELDRDYARHSRAARAMAEDHFEAATILGRMLDDAGFR